eukprot:g42793.t1
MGNQSCVEPGAFWDEVLVTPYVLQLLFNLQCLPNPTAEACPCHKDLSRLDKVFVMLEDSQMRQNMLLHSVNEVLAAELRAMRSEVQQALAGGTEACRHAHHHQKDTGSVRFTKLLELAREGAVKWQLEHTKKLQEVFLSVMGLYDRLGTLDKHLAKSETSKAMSGEQSMCTSLIEELQQTRDGLLTVRAQGPTPHSETHSQETPGDGNIFSMSILSKPLYQGTPLLSLRFSRGRFLRLVELEEHSRPGSIRGARNLTFRVRTLLQKSEFRRRVLTRNINFPAPLMLPGLLCSSSSK